MGLLSIPWGNTVHWNILCGSFKFIEGIEKANIGWLSGHKEIVKKQSLGSITNKCQFFGIILRLGRPGCTHWNNNSINSSQISKHFYLPDFFHITNTGELQRLKISIICPLLSCSLINLCKASNFSCFRGHCSIYTGWSVFQLRGISVGGGRLVGEAATSEKEKWKKVKSEVP